MVGGTRMRNAQSWMGPILVDECLFEWIETSTDKEAITAVTF